MKKFLGLLMALVLIVFVPSGYTADTVAHNPLYAPLIEDDIDADNAPADKDILGWVTGNKFHWYSIDEAVALATLTDGKIWIGDGTNHPAAQTMSGDVTIDNSGVATIGTDKIDEGMVNWGSGADQIDLADIPGGISGAQVWDFGGATSFEMVNKDADPDTLGQFLHDTAITGLTAGGLKWYDTDSVRIIVDVEASDFGTGPTDDYVIAYDADNDKHYYKEDAGGGGNPGSFGSAVAKTLDADGKLTTSTDNFITVQANTGVTDDLVEIIGAAAGDIIVLQPDSGDTITVKNGTYIRIGEDFILDDVSDKIALICYSLGANDYFDQVSRSSGN